MASLTQLKSWTYLAVGTALLSSFGAVAQAQQADEVSVAPEAPQAPDDTSVVGGDGDSAAEVKLSPAELRVQGAEVVATIQGSFQSVRSMAAAAKDKHDVVKVLCLDDKTTQVGAAASTAEERSEALVVALDNSTLERARHEYVMLMTLRDRVETLMNEANQCIGEETGFTGDAQLTVEIDPNLPQVQADIVGFVAIVAIAPSLSSAVY